MLSRKGIDVDYHSNSIEILNLNFLRTLIKDNQINKSKIK